jgi:hypothetical protein
MKSAAQTLTLLAAGLIASNTLYAASAELRYGFKDGATYLVKQQYHDVSTTVTTINMMGQNKTLESRQNRSTSSSWQANAQRSGNTMTLDVNYGTQQGGDRWGDPASKSGENIYGDSSARVTFDSRKGMVSLSTKPADDPIVDLIYRSRFFWMPRLPNSPLKVGDSFTYDYTMQSGMVTMKGEDEYILDEVSGGNAYFTVESQMLTVIDYSKMYQQQEGLPEGAGQMMVGGMTLAHEGEGTAIFDLKEGIFVEREMKTAYTSKKSESPGMMINRMNGTTRDRWEMERR